MFEQSVIADQATRRTSLFFFVTSAQVAAVVVAAIAPLFWIVLPPIAKLPTAMHWTPPHVNLVPVPEELAAQPQTHRLFHLVPIYAPRSVPNGIRPEPPDVLLDPPATVAGGPEVSYQALNPGILAIPSLAPAPPRKETAPVMREPMRVSQGVQEAKLIRRVLPIYPRLAIQTRQFGTVRLEAIIATDGSIRSIRVLSGPAFLVPAAVEAVRQWLYKPTLLNGVPVEVLAPITINFKLSQ